MGTWSPPEALPLFAGASCLRCLRLKTHAAFEGDLAGKSGIADNECTALFCLVGVVRLCDCKKSGKPVENTRQQHEPPCQPRAGPSGIIPIGCHQKVHCPYQNGFCSLLVCQYQRVVRDACAWNCIHAIVHGPSRHYPRGQAGGADGRGGGGGRQEREEEEGEEDIA
eukprot:6354426-Pyramimonas_sp.AAC.1